jgi:type I restriction enzyme R subunit
VATIYFFVANEEQSAIDDITYGSFDISPMNRNAEEFLDAANEDCNGYLYGNFITDSNGFQSYYRDLALRVKNQDIDLLIIVGMFSLYSPNLNSTEPL